MSPPYPFLISYVLVAINVSMQGMNFGPSNYNILESGTNKLRPVANNNVRNSQIYQTPLPILDSVSQPIINDYLNIHRPEFQYANASVNWRVLRYNQTGHFLEHRDRERPIDGYEHFATQIFLPPKNQVDFKGGELTIWNNGKNQNLKPHATKWTHIIMPLGIMHKVHKITQGTRISYVKSVYLKKKGTKAQQQSHTQPPQNMLDTQNTAQL